MWWLITCFCVWKVNLVHVVSNCLFLCLQLQHSVSSDWLPVCVCVCACMRACACMSSWERVCVPCMHVYINANTYFWILSWVLVTKTNTVLISVFRESLSDECQSRVQSASRPSGAWGQATSHPPCAEATQFHLPILSFVRGKGRLWNASEECWECVRERSQILKEMGREEVRL